MKFGKIHSLGAIKISGQDAHSFLQGQLTNDINDLTQNWQFSGYCNPKGRLLALFQIWRSADNEVYALLSKDLVDPVIKRLRMYVMRSNVVIEELDQLNIYGLSSLEYLTEISPVSFEAIKPDTNNQVFYNGNTALLMIDQHALLVSEDSYSDIEVNNFDERWTQLNVEHGFPQISLDSSELFIPQMVNLDLLGGISFNKGCYTGQEIVARMHYLGKLKQRMFVYAASEKLQGVLAGDKVVRDDTSTAGLIVSASNDSKMCLAVIKLDSSDEALFLESGLKLEKLSDQPYLLK